MLGIADRNVLTRSRFPTTGREERIDTILGVETGRWLNNQTFPPRSSAPGIVANILWYMV
jgi:hypothetical protein